MNTWPNAPRPRPLTTLKSLMLLCLPRWSKVITLYSSLNSRYYEPVHRQEWCYGWSASEIGRYPSTFFKLLFCTKLWRHCFSCRIANGLLHNCLAEMKATQRSFCRRLMCQQLFNLTQRGRWNQATMLL